MTVIEAITYGVIQGLSEFLPVSSSGHLALLPYVMKIEDPGVVFDLMMHLGTAIAVCTYFRSDLWRYVRTFSPSLADLKKGTPDQWFVRNYTFATFVSVLTIVTLMPLSRMARSPSFIIFNLCFFGLVLWAADNFNRKRPAIVDDPFKSEMKWKWTIIMGMAQALAIFPGVSRSGITLSAALFLGMNRRSAGAFSFLMSLPIILAGILKEVPDLMQGSSDNLTVLLTGVVVSFVVGWFTIHFFMKLIQKIHLGWFTLYRFVIAVVLLWMIY